MAGSGWRVVLLLASVAVGVGGCKSGKSCTAGARQCVDERAALVCPADGSGAVTVNCLAGETCSGGSCVASGGCTAGDRQCLDDHVARICDSTGTTWISEPCDSTQMCTSGTCVLNPDAGVICAPGTKECVDTRLARVCTPDGTGWAFESCAAGETCTSGSCGPSTDTACTPYSGQCINGASAVCKADGTGYTVSDCPGASICTGSGVCQGVACAVGTRCTSQGNLRACTDGSGAVETPCPQGQSCVDPDPTHGAAACKTNQCPGPQTVCGNKVDAGADQTKYYSTCVLTPNGYQWAVTQCTGYLTCSSGACTAACIPGRTQCVNVLGGMGVSTCGADGTWGMPVDCGAQTCGVNATAGVAACADPGCETGQKGVCTATGARLCTNGTLGPDQALTCTTGVCAAGECKPQCVDGTTKCLTLATGDVGVVTCASGRWPTTSLGELCYSPTTGMPNRTCYAVTSAWAVCADPECATGQHGLCTTDGKIRECVDGKLAAAGSAVDCPAGQICTGTACASALCAAGETLCAGSPVYNGYRSCVNGTFSSQVTFCPSAADAGPGLQGCTDSVGANNLRTALCGVECVPGARSCVSDVQDGGTSIAKLRVCDTTGTWGAATTCPYGDCIGTYPNAGCQADCLPGQVRCAGATVSHPDLHLNVRAGSQTCNANGLWDTTVTTCAAGQYCRTNSTGVAYGCVECVGSSNEVGKVDIRCSGTTALQECTASNTWSSSTVACNGTCTAASGGNPAYCPTTGPYGSTCFSCANTTCGTYRSACLADPTCVTNLENCLATNNCWNLADFYDCLHACYYYADTTTNNYHNCLTHTSPPAGCYAPGICYYF